MEATRLGNSKDVFYIAHFRVVSLIGFLTRKGKAKEVEPKGRPRPAIRENHDFTYVGLAHICEMGSSLNPRTAKLDHCGWM